MKHYDTISIDAVIQEYIDFVDPKTEVPRQLLIKWANDVLEKLVTTEQYDFKVKLFCVKDYTIKLDDNTKSLAQVAYRPPNEKKKCKRVEIVEWTENTFNGCELNISVECPKCHSLECTCEGPEITFDADRLFRQAHPELQYGHMDHLRTWGGLGNYDNLPPYPPCMFHPEFYLIRPASHDFFNADFHVKGCLNLDEKLMSKVPVNYRVNERTLRINRRDGDILIAYLAAKTDEDGNMLVPNVPDVFEAIRWTLIENMSWRTYYKTRNSQYRVDAQEARQLRLEAMGRAYEVLGTIEPDEFMDTLADLWVRVYPWGSYYENMHRSFPDRYGTDMDRLTQHK